MDRTEKQSLVESLHEVFEASQMVVVTHYSGLTVAEMEQLRGQMRDAGARFKVTKNRLTLRALEGTKFEGLADMFKGPTGIAYSEDPVAAAKGAVEFSKKNEKLIVLGAGFGDQVLDLQSVKTIAGLPSLDALRANIVGMLNTPATRIAGVLQAPAGQVARVLSARSQQSEAA
ncbi:MAG: 50S ribosomal protein L10 [Rhodospirillales bacterium]